MIEWHDRFQRPQQMMRQFARASHLVLYAANQFHSGSAVRMRPIETNILEVVLPGDPAANVYQNTLTGDDCARMLAAIERLGTELGLSQAVVVAQHAYWTPLADSLRARFGWPIVYDCMDDHAGFLHIAAEVLKTEARLIAAADLVVASSRRLYEGIRARSARPPSSETPASMNISAATTIGRRFARTIRRSDITVRSPSGSTASWSRS